MNAEWQIHATHELANDIGEWLAMEEEGCIAASLLSDAQAHGAEHAQPVLVATDDNPGGESPRHCCWDQSLRRLQPVCSRLLLHASTSAGQVPNLRLLLAPLSVRGRSHRQQDERHD
jgi:hypothetical protein